MKIRALPWLCGLSMMAGQAAIAQIATDGTAGDRVTLEGDDIEITEDLGTRTGDNLFHSFEEFSIDEGQIATFSGADAIEHVISRVTGGSRSDIDGTLRSTISGADLWFFNPAGIAFGAGARLDVDGSLHVSTADEVTFADGASFGADLSSTSSLTAAAPEAFGFLGSDPAEISIDRSTLELPPGETFSIVGGNITIDGGGDGTATGGEQGLVRAEGGTINLLASGGPGVATIDDGTLSSAETGDIAITDQAHVDTSGDGGGSIRIRGGALALDGGSFVSADNTGATDATGGIDVEVDSILAENGSQIRADVAEGAAGDGGAVRVDVEDGINLLSGGEIRSETRGSGDTTLVQVEAESIKVAGSNADETRRSGIGSEVGGGGVGDAGQVVVRSDTIELSDFGLITSSSFGSGTGGEISVDANDIEISTGGLIRTNAFDVGDAGTIDVTANVLTIDGAGRPSGIVSEAAVSADGDGVVTVAEGDAGDIAVSGDSLKVTLLNEGNISSTTFGVGDAGDVTVQAESIYADATGASFLTGIASDSGLFVTREGQALAIGQGNAGLVDIDADDITLKDGANIRSVTFGAGNANRVEVDADNITLENGSIRSTAAAFLQGDGQVISSTGSAGAVDVRADGDITISRNGTITSTTFGEGDAGDIIVKAGSIFIDGIDPRFITGIQSNSGLLLFNDGTQIIGSGNAGNVDVTASGDITIVDGGTINASTFGEGDAGSVVVSGRQIVINGEGGVRNTGIVSEASQTVDRSVVSDGNGGSVRVRAESVHVKNGGRIRAATSGAGRAGVVDIEASEVSISSEFAEPSSIDSAAFAFDGGPEANAGGVTINADTIDIGPNGQVSSEARGQGTAGTVSIIADHRLSMNEGRISTNSAQGGGGVIELDVVGFIDLQNSTISTSVAAGDDPTAGNIGIDSDVLVIQDSRIAADAPEGFGGNIEIVADNLLESGGTISASGEQTGTVTVVTREQDVAGQLAALQGSLLDASSLLRDRCATRRDVGASSFTGVPAPSKLINPDAPRLTGSVFDREERPDNRSGDAMAPGGDGLRIASLMPGCSAPAEEAVSK